MAIELTGAPNLSALYARALAVGPARRKRSELPTTECVRRDAAVDPEHLAAYNRVCGFRLRDELPPTYPHMLAFPASVRLMAEPGFPFSPVGLVHVANTIRQSRSLLVTESLTLSVRMENLRAHPKGQCFDVVAEIGAGDEPVWREVSTYLSRGKPDESVPREQWVPAELEPGAATARWRVPGDMGRRYGAVSGDRNPIHMHPLAAKAFGFPRAIVHGMWSKARCLAAFDGRLPEAADVRVEFRKPVLLPSTVEFTERGGDFALHSRSGKPHLFGTVRDFA